MNLLKSSFLEVQLWQKHQLLPDRLKSQSSPHERKIVVFAVVAVEDSCGISAFAESVSVSLQTKE
jgi:hypothetical protein